MTSAQSRRKEIHRMTLASGPISVEELAQRFHVTQSTIRRDLAVLHGEGKLLRTYGGVLPSSSNSANSVSQHLGPASDQKESIGRWAGGQVASGESILLDGGSTVRAIIPWLSSLDNLTVTTPDVETLEHLAPLKGVELNCLGGRLPHSATTFEGPVTEAALEGLRFDKVFLGASALTPEDGVFSETQARSWLRELMARRGEFIFILADSTKLGPKRFPACRRLSMPWTLVTDSAADPILLTQFHSAGAAIQVVSVQPLASDVAGFEISSG